MQYIENKIYCSSCGAQINSNSKFCYKCGVRLEHSGEQTGDNPESSQENAQPVVAPETSESAPQDAIKLTVPPQAMAQESSQPMQPNNIEYMMEKPVPPVQPARQPEKGKSGFLKGMLVGCLIPVILFFILAAVAFFLFNTVMSGLLIDIFSNMLEGY